MISYAANEWGYVVQVTQDGRVMEEYHAGNHRFDSQRTVNLDHPDIESVAVLEEYAKQTAMLFSSKQKWQIVVQDPKLVDKIYSTPLGYRSA